MVISNNVVALDTYKALKSNNKTKESAISRLTSGLRIQSAKDDAAGLSISEKMKTQIRGLSKASCNAESAISMLQIADSALSETHKALGRMRELSVSAANDANSELDRSMLQEELASLTNEINRIGINTEFNGMKLLSGVMSDSRIFDNVNGAFIGGEDNSIYFHIGANSGEKINVSFDDMTAVAIGIAKIHIEDEKTGEGTININGSIYSAIFSKKKNVFDEITKTFAAHSLDITTRKGANDAISIIDESIKKVSCERSKYGAMANRLEYTINSLDVICENMVASRSRIGDSNVAKEMVTLTKSNLLLNAAQTMLSQAMLKPENALGLLKDCDNKNQKASNVVHTNNIISDTKTINGNKKASNKRQIK